MNRDAVAVIDAELARVEGRFAGLRRARELLSGVAVEALRPKPLLIEGRKGTGFRFANVE